MVKHLRRIPGLGLLDFLGVFLLLVVLYAPRGMAGDPGLGWHLKAGELMFSKRSLLEFDPFLYYADSSPPVWIHDQWLSDVLFYLIYSSAGFLGLHVFTLIISVWSWLLLAASYQARFKQEASLVLAVSLLLSAMTAAGQWIVRPVVISFFLFSVLLVLLLRLREAQGSAALRNTAFIGLSFILWANLHPGFILGLFVVGVFAVLRFAEGRKSSLFLPLLAGLSTLANPWGYKLHLSALALASDPYFTKLNKEWLPPDFLAGEDWPFLLLALLLCAVDYRERLKSKSKSEERKPLPAFEFLLSLILAFASLKHRRYLSFWALLATPLVFPMVDALGIKWRVNDLLGKFLPGKKLFYSSALSLGLAFLVLSRAAVPGVQTSSLGFPARYPQQLVQRLQGLPEGTILNHPDLGGFLTFSLYPRQRAFIDDRNQLLSKERYEKVFSLLKAEPGWESRLKDLDFSYAVLERTYPLHEQMEKSWEVLYQDEKFSLFGNPAKGFFRDWQG